MYRTPALGDPYVVHSNLHIIKDIEGKDHKTSYRNKVK